MLLLNKICFPINIAIAIGNLWLHQPGWALVSALCAWCNLYVINNLGEKR